MLFIINFQTHTNLTQHFCFIAFKRPHFISKENCNRKPSPFGLVSTVKFYDNIEYNSIEWEKTLPCKTLLRILFKYKPIIIITCLKIKLTNHTTYIINFNYGLRKFDIVLIYNMAMGTYFDNHNYTISMNRTNDYLIKSMKSI